ncbi:MAG TPA: small basic protein [Phycisphaerales bacterium]|nr:small basic protein [Phycisphaerales bacterium]
MSLNRSLKTKGNLAGKRSVMTRAERIEKLTEDQKFEAGKTSPLGLPKTQVVEK